MFFGNAVLPEWISTRNTTIPLQLIITTHNPFPYDVAHWIRSHGMIIVLPRGNIVRNAIKGGGSLGRWYIPQHFTR